MSESSEVPVEFPVVTSRQRIWQDKQLADGRCSQCGSDRGRRARICEGCAEKRRKSYSESREGKPRLKPRVVWNERRDAMLGKACDRVVAKRLGVRPHDVFYRRKKLGIAPFRGYRKKATYAYDDC